LRSLWTGNALVTLWASRTDWADWADWTFRPTQTDNDINAWNQIWCININALNLILNRNINYQYIINRVNINH
jgi:hypothetical protein